MKLGLSGLAIMGATALDAAEPQGVAQVVDLARDAEVVVLGEVHDNPAHHRIQAEIVAALQPAALVFEMIPQKREAVVNDLRAKDASRADIAEALDWADSGWPDFGFYADILEAAPKAVVFGAGQPIDDVQRAMSEGAAAVFGPDAPTYGLDQPLGSEEQAAREVLQADAHCGVLPAEMLPGMVEAQRFRDAGLADATLWARTLGGGGQVVVITGTGHADRARGVPATLAIAAPDLVVVSLGQVEGTPDPADHTAFDLVLAAPPVPRDDPCAALASPEG